MPDNSQTLKRGHASAEMAVPSGVESDTQIVGNLTAIYEEQEDGGYVAYIAEVRGIVTQGDTLEEARENLYDALQLILETKRDIAEREIKSKNVVRESLPILAA